MRRVTTQAFTFGHGRMASRGCNLSFIVAHDTQRVSVVLKSERFGCRRLVVTGGALTTLDGRMY